jgi:hypothetical protein
MAKLTTPGTYFAIGETVRNFTCQIGHFPSSDRGMTCQSDGSWSDIITCVKGMNENYCVLSYIKCVPVITTIVEITSIKKGNFERNNIVVHEHPKIYSSIN